MATAGIYCRKCNYDLQGQVGAEQRCPECGREFNARDKRTFRRKPLQGAWVRWLRRVAVGLLVIGIVLGATWGWLYWGWKSEQRAVDKMKGWNIVQKPLGGERLKKCLGSLGGVLDRVTEFELPYSSNDADLAPVMELKRLQMLQIQNTNITDAGLVYLKHIKGLQHLCLDATQVTDAGLVNLKDLKGLQHLLLGKTKITDAGLEQLKVFRDLQSLDLEATQVTDAGLVHLKVFKELQYLDLTATHVTDAGLEHLKGLKGLKMLLLSQTKVTEAGVKDLQAAIPSTSIYGP